MSETTHQQERMRDFERFLTFIDAIVAIAATLLVLPLVELVGDLGAGDSVGDLLVDQRGPIGAFFLSFVVIANLWMIQHRMLRNVVAANALLTRLLLLWSLTIVVLPFPTALAAGPGDVGEQTATKAFYVGTMLVSSFVLSLIALVVARHRHLRDSDQAPDALRAFGSTATFAIALVVMVLVPATSYWPLLLLLLSDRAVSLGRHLTEPAAT